MVEDQKRKTSSFSQDEYDEDNDPTINYPVDLSKKKKRRIMTNKDIEGGSKGEKMLLATTTRTTATSNIVSDDDDDDDVSRDSAWDVFDNFIGRSNVNPNTVDDDPNYEEGFDFYRDLQRKIVAEDMERMILHADDDSDDDAPQISKVKSTREKKKRIKASRIMERIRNRRSSMNKDSNSRRSLRRSSSELEKAKKEEEGEGSNEQQQEQEQEQQSNDNNINVNSTKDLRKNLVYDERTERLVYVDKDKDAKQKYAANQIQKKNTGQKTKPKRGKTKITKHNKKNSDDNLDDMDQSLDRVSKFLRRFQRNKVVLSRANGRFA